MKNKCEICNVEFGIFNWRHKCKHCDKEICGKHFKNSFCSNCNKNIVDVIIFT
jgi:hypothetical protein